MLLAVIGLQAVDCWKTFIFQVEFLHILANELPPNLPSAGSSGGITADAVLTKGRCLRETLLQGYLEDDHASSTAEEGGNAEHYLEGLQQHEILMARW